MKRLNLIEIVGKPLSDKNVLDLLALIKRDAQKIKIKRGEIDAVIENEKMGVQLTFINYEFIKMGLTDPDIDISPELSVKLQEMEQQPEDTLFLSDIDIDECPDNEAINALLPTGLTFGMNKLQVYEILGQPNLGENEEFGTAGWMYDYYKYAVRFTENGEFFSFGVNFMEHSHLMEF